MEKAKDLPLLSRRSLLRLGLAALYASRARAGEAAVPEGEYESHGLSIFGDLELPAEFAHFPYVNPEAPKGGAIALEPPPTKNDSFDSLNGYILRGNPAAGLNLVFDTLMTVLSDKPLSPDAIREFYLAMVMGSVLYIPVAVLFWFAPLLVAWHGIPVGKALFFSWMAVWRNRAAFIAYGVLVAILLIAVPLFIDALFASSGANNIAPIIATPYRILVMAVLYCSFYATYRGCFNVTQAAGQTTDTTA